VSHRSAEQSTCGSESKGPSPVDHPTFPSVEWQQGATGAIDWYLFRESCLSWCVSNWSDFWPRLPVLLGEDVLLRRRQHGQTFLG
jgi:hypothetical protein